MRCVSLRWIWLAAVLVCSACESNPVNPDMVPVSGTITYQGQPVAHANVTFHSDTQSSFGLTDAQGRFQMQSILPNDGALPGTYPVSIIKMEIAAPKFDEGHPQYVPPPPPKYLVPKKYSEPRTSGLTADVERGKKNEFAFELKD